MPAKTWTLTDVAAGQFVEALKLGPADVPGSPKGWSISKRTLRGGLSDGVDAIRVECGKLSFVVLPTRGMGIWKVWRGELEIGWKSPVRGPVHPQFVPLAEAGGLGWLDGFDELFVRCGLESNGAPEFDKDGRLKYPLHGRIANKPAHKVDLAVDESGEITITGVVDESRFHFTKLRLTTTIKTKPGEPGLRIRDEIENLSGSPATAQMLYHVNFGEPLLDAGARFVAPLKTVVPRNELAAAGIKNWASYSAPEAGFEEQVYFLELLAASDGRTRTLLKNAHGTQGASLVFSKQQLPCYSVWKNTTASADGSVTGLEPATNYPNPRNFEGEQGRVVKLAPGGKTAFDIALEIHTTPAEVETSERAIAALQGSVSPTVYDSPQKGWCA
jgi:galactose mutarotase-like enzyme